MEKVVALRWDPLGGITTGLVMGIVGMMMAMGGVMRMFMVVGTALP